ncbi:MAG: UDP-galactopyranose mutase [Firmicutes bacterium]|nr:UDP-galactopyranose mutase [Bacillota bacterium]
MKKYNYLIVGAGLFGAVFAQQATAQGKTCLVIDRRQHIAGNAYTENIHGINVHKYGAHIFHTSNKAVWDYVNQFAEFNNYVNSPIARYKNELYNLPFNMNTFYQLWRTATPAEAQAAIENQRIKKENPANLEEQALNLAGTDIYEKLIKGYTEKQWGRDCKQLPADIIKRLPFRFTYDNNYFNDPYQGIAKGGYTQMVANMLKGVEVKTSCSYVEFIKDNPQIAETTIYTGAIDEFFDYKLGKLEYRALKFETEYKPDCDNFQGNAVVNYTEREIPYTRIIEHKHFEQFGTFGEPVKGTFVTHEYPAEWQKGQEPYYPINDDKNNDLYNQYKKLADQQKNIFFGGRLGMYSYFDMDKVIAKALEFYKDFA